MTKKEEFVMEKSEIKKQLTDRETEKLKKDIETKNTKNIFNLIYKNYKIVFEKLKNV